MSGWNIQGTVKVKKKLRGREGRTVVGLRIFFFFFLV